MDAALGLLLDNIRIPRRPWDEWTLIHEREANAGKNVCAYLCIVLLLVEMTRHHCCAYDCFNGSRKKKETRQVPRTY